MSVAWGKDADLDVMAMNDRNNSRAFLAGLTGLFAGGLLGLVVGLILGMVAR